MADKEELEYWTSIRVGDFVSLNDYQSMEAGGAGGVNYRVQAVHHIAVRDRDMKEALMEYHLHELSSPERGRVSFVVADSGSEFELRVYFIPSGFMAGTRDELIDAGHTWFFLPPSNPDDFVSSSLEYAPYPDVPPIEENGKAVRREFAFAGFGRPVYGSYMQDDEEVPIIVTEYATEERPAMNPLMLLTEERWILPDGTIPPEGGYITPYLGCIVAAGDAEVFPS